jgi:hypothetical protein
MYLDVVRTGRRVLAVSNGHVNGKRSPKAVFERWKDWAPSAISHHGRICCEIAREWITATDYSSLSGGHMMQGPRWLRHKFRWGPSSYPLFWCGAVRKEMLDCGALAALAHEVFTIRGVKSYRVQLVQRYSRVATEQWSNSWTGDGVPTLWLNKDMIYHEGCATAAGKNEIKVWDASGGCWIDPKASDGYGALLAIKINASPKTRTLAWGKYMLDPNVWRTLD